MVSSRVPGSPGRQSGSPHHDQEASRQDPPSCLPWCGRGLPPPVIRPWGGRLPVGSRRVEVGGTYSLSLLRKRQNLPGLSASPSVLTYLVTYLSHIIPWAPIPASPFFLLIPVHVILSNDVFVKDDKDTCSHFLKIWNALWLNDDWTRNKKSHWQSIIVF